MPVNGAIFIEIVRYSEVNPVTFSKAQQRSRQRSIDGDRPARSASNGERAVLDRECNIWTRQCGYGWSKPPAAAAGPGREQRTKGGETSGCRGPSEESATIDYCNIPLLSTATTSQCAIKLKCAVETLILNQLPL